MPKAKPSSASASSQPSPVPVLLKEHTLRYKRLGREAVKKYGRANEMKIMRMVQEHRTKGLHKDHETIVNLAKALNDIVQLYENQMRETNHDPKTLDSLLNFSKSLLKSKQEGD